MPFPKNHAGIQSKTLVAWLALTMVLGFPALWALAQSPTGVDLPGLDKLPVIKELPDSFLMNSGQLVSGKKEGGDWIRQAGFHGCSQGIFLGRPEVKMKRHCGGWR